MTNFVVGTWSLIAYMHLVGFINPGSLMGLLPSKSLAQQTMLRTTHNSWDGLKYLTTGQRGDPVSDWKAWPKRNNSYF